MVINEIGEYKLLKDITIRNSTSIGTLPKGSVLNITQIDKKYHKVISSELMDWIYWDLPAEKID